MFLFATLAQAKPKREVAKSISDTINNLLVKEGIKINLFEGEVEKQNFIAGGNADKTEAYFYKEAEKKFKEVSFRFYV